MAQGLVSQFYACIERHLEESRSTLIESGISPTPGTSAKRAFECMSIDYLDAVQDLRDKISACLEVNGSSSFEDLHSMVPLSPMLLWMIPAFAFSSQFLDPVDAHSSCVADQKTRSGQEDNFTDDIWNNDLIHDWAGADESRLLLLQGNSCTVKRFQRFSVEIVHAMKAKQVSQPLRLAYVLNTPRTHESPTQLVPSDLLQQIAIQCLQYVRPKAPVKFLIDIFGRFKNATTCGDYFGILQDICVLIPSLYIIIDLAVLGSSHEEPQSWPAPILDMLDHFKGSKPGCRIKVMLLSCRKFTSPSDATLVINEPSPGSAYPNGHQTLKELRKQMADPGDILRGHCEEGEAAGASRITSVMTESSSPYDGTVSGDVLSATPQRSSQTRYLEIGSSSPAEPQNRSDFRIAIICALTFESDAVRDIFDKKWDAVRYGKTTGDPNYYSTGAIGQHNVVVVHMPGVGKSNGAAAAANCKASFPCLRLVLVVGTCGGVPFPRNGTEIVLGDIIVSDGLIQYDFGRQFPDRFVRKSDSTFAKPNSEISSFLAKMKGRWGMKELRERTAIHLEHLRHSTDVRTIADYPGKWRDNLYEPTYRHKHQCVSTCKICNECHTNNDPVCEAALTLDCETLKCDDGPLIARQRLASHADETENEKENSQPSIHFGLYASGDKVMKSGEEREMVAKEEGIIAFEMEAAGVWECFSSGCLIVKAVCNYADSHKDKRWQTYAAATAAAGTKALLESWYP